jgi:hypothetical protein
MEHKHENKEHKCAHGKCCDKCCNCHCHIGGKSWKGYYWKHMIILVLGVVLAFLVGLKLGVIKGLMMSEYGPSLFGHHMKWGHRDMYKYHQSQVPVPQPGQQPMQPAQPIDTSVQ